MREDLVKEIGLVFQELTNLFQSVSPWFESRRVAGTFKSLLDRMREVYYTQITERDDKLLNLILQGYKLIEEMPKCMFKTPNCLKEHNDWGLRVQEHTWVLIGEFKKRGIDFGYSPPETEPSFKLNEETILRFGFIAVVVYIAIQILKGGKRRS
jgi:hypothetical protein